MTLSDQCRQFTPNHPLTKSTQNTHKALMISKNPHIKMTMYPHQVPQSLELIGTFHLAQVHNLYAMEQLGTASFCVSPSLCIG